MMSERKKQRVNGPKRRGQTVKAQSDAGLAEVARATSRLWRKHHLSYDQTKYLVERARRALGVEPPRTGRRTVQRLDYPEVERLIRSAYRDSSAYGVMIKTLFLTGARVNEFVHIRVEDLYLDEESPQIYLTHVAGGLPLRAGAARLGTGAAHPPARPSAGLPF
jgi:integrase/recombinase XerD